MPHVTGCMMIWYRMLDIGSAHELAGQPGSDMGDQVERVHVSCVCAVDAPSAARGADQEAHAPHAVRLSDMLACEMNFLCGGTRAGPARLGVREPAARPAVAVRRWAQHHLWRAGACAGPPPCFIC